MGYFVVLDALAGLAVYSSILSKLGVNSYINDVDGIVYGSDLSMDTIVLLLGHLRRIVML